MILLDEVEKAHADVFNILLQVLEDGRITDSQGRVVDFRNTVIVMTSNIGSEHILDISDDDSQYEKMRNRVMGALRKHFRPEFVNRIDDLIIFHPLGKKQMRDIVRIQLKRVENLLGDQKILVEITPAACDKLVEIGYDPMYGARPIKRAIQREIENPLATKILENTFVPGDTIIIDEGKTGLTFSKKSVVRVSSPVNSVQLVESAEG